MVFQEERFNLLVVLGPTASGKTRLGVQLAQKVGGEIISADSRQVFRGMDIGTGKDLNEYGTVPYHLIDIAEPGTEFSVFDFQRAFFRTFEEICDKGNEPVLVGGTGLYLDAVLRRYRLVEVPENPKLRAELSSLNENQLRQRLLEVKPEQHNTTDLARRERLVRAIEIAEGELAADAIPALPEIKPLVLGIQWPRSELRRRIAERLQERLRQGMIEEVMRLHEQGVAWETLELYGLEYRFIAWFLQGQLSFNEMQQQLARAINKFAKRQETWFRRMERKGVVIHWIEGGGDMVSQAARLLEASWF